MKMEFKNCQLNSCCIKHLFIVENIIISIKISGKSIVIIIVLSLSHVWLFATSWTVAHQAPLSSTISRSLLKFMSIELVMPSNHFILCYPFSFSLQSFPASRSVPMSGSSHQVAKVLQLQLYQQSFQWIFMVNFL